jgi:hypothetical protein
MNHAGVLKFNLGEKFGIMGWSLFQIGCRSMLREMAAPDQPQETL